MENEQTPSDVQVKVRQLLGQATLMRARGKQAEALKIAQEALTLDEENADAHEMVGDLLMDLKRGAQAVASFKRARELNPSRVALEDKLARAALLRAQGLQTAAQAEAMLSGRGGASGPVHKPGYAALLSAIPGLGQIYNEQLAKGLAMLAGWIALLAIISRAMKASMLEAVSSRVSGYGAGPDLWSAFTGVNVVWTVLLIGLHVYAIVDAAVCASRTMTSDSSGLV